MSRLFSYIARTGERARSGSQSPQISEIEERLEELDVNLSTMSGDTNGESTSETKSSERSIGCSFRLLDLPPELIDQVLSHLNAVTLAQLALTCRSLHRYSYDERHWARIVHDLELPTRDELPSPFSKWRELYSAHYPYWFLPKHKIWFADRATRDHPLTGQLTLARYDYRMGNIELYRVYAENLAMVSHQWSWRPSVLIHAFNPRIRLLLDDPIVKLEVGIYGNGGRLQKEISLTRGYERFQIGLRSEIFLTRPIPPDKQAQSMALWPPGRIPADNRVRAESSNFFRGSGHKPSNYSELSESTFRTRVWQEFLGTADRIGARMGEDVITFSTLPPDCYTPTPTKPYQGLWVGDYSGHGCEFLLITQKNPLEAAYIPPISPMSEAVREELLGPIAHNTATGHDIHEPQEALNENSDPMGCSGRLEAIKLTGDVNIPKGEYTFVAEDIGHKGLLRVAREAPFMNARVVKCWGHVASRGFVDDGYIPSQLIMISHNELAQYWEEFGHISFFKRFEIDDFLDVEKAPPGKVL